VSLAVNVGVSLRLSRTAKRTGSVALAGDAAHLGTDALTSAAVLVGLILVAITGAQWIDPVVALAVAALVVTTGVRLLAQGLNLLQLFAAEFVDILVEWQAVLFNSIAAMLPQKGSEARWETTIINKQAKPSENAVPAKSTATPCNASPLMRRPISATIPLPVFPRGKESRGRPCLKITCPFLFLSQSWER